MGLRDLFRKGPALNDRSKVDGIFYKDLQVCSQLVKHGIALDKPVHSLFYLYFPGESGADAAAGALGARGLTTTVRAPWADGEVRVDSWTVIAESRTNALVPDFLRETVNTCEALATHYGGEFDGWEAGPADGGLGTPAPEA